MVTATEVSTIAVDEETREHVRFDIHQRLQHALLMSSFIVLLLTGLPMKYSEAGISEWMINAYGGIESTRGLHHLAAYVMLLDCVYHLLYLGASIFILRRPFPKKMLLTPFDFRDFAQDLAHFVGLRKEGPRFDRYSWRDKFDYWAIFWGMPVMAMSGYILLNPVWASSHLPEWAVPVAYVAHSDEALLALTWIAIPHLVFAHLAPHVYPMNKSIFTGKITMKQFREEHPKEWERALDDADEETN